MKKTVILSFLMIFASSTAMAYGYDYVDEMSNRELANISAQEQADVMHELREGDYREAQEIIREDEAIKNQIRQQEAMYDRVRDMNQYNYYGYYGYPR
ncbi:MAG: hypothetical protein D0528_11700 [Methylococcales bacterium]|nr:MAG: hypothetical protein D0528_11700 [Methylococcales bacterium]